MQKIPDADGDKAARNEAQLARVTRLIRLSDTRKTLWDARDQPKPVFSGQDAVGKGFWL